MNKVIISYPQEFNNDKKKVSVLVNQTLQSIKEDVAAWNGFVDLRITMDGYALVAKCDNEDLRKKMQELLNNASGSLRAA